MWLPTVFAESTFVHLCNISITLLSRREAIITLSTLDRVAIWMLTSIPRMEQWKTLTTFSTLPTTPNMTSREAVQTYASIVPISSALPSFDE